MKKLIASASLVAVGAAGLQAANAPGLTRTETSKPWSVSASLRGFYDDNYATAPTGSPQDRDSWGFEVSPKAAVNFPMQQTYVGASYQYSLKYYEDRDDDNIDQFHDFRLKADHRFNERYDVYLDEAFIMADEPDLIEPGGNAPIRTDASAIRNNVGVGFNASITELIGANLGYKNGFWDYDDSGDGSRSAQLDRMEHLANIDGIYRVREDIDAVLGYMFGATQYKGDYLFFLPGSVPLDENFTSDIRDSMSHYVYVGTDADITSTLNTSLRVGAQYVDFDDLNEDDFSPYANITLTYTYSPGSYLQFGITHKRMATDVAAADLESSSVFGLVNHRITPKLTGNILVQGQYSEFNEGPYDGDADKFFIVGANLDYAINQFLNAEVGYNLDRLDSELSDRSFTRNRVYLGLRATY